MPKGQTGRPTSVKLTASSGLPEIALAKPNYRHAKKQKEAARKARQLEKQQRRSARTGGAEPTADTTPAESGEVVGTPVTRP